MANGPDIALELQLRSKDGQHTTPSEVPSEARSASEGDKKRDTAAAADESSDTEASSKKVSCCITLHDIHISLV